MGLWVWLGARCNRGIEIILYSRLSPTERVGRSHDAAVQTGLSWPLTRDQGLGQGRGCELWVPIDH